MPEGINILGILKNVSMLADGGWKVEFEVGESNNREIAILMELRNRILGMGIVPTEHDPIDETSMGGPEVDLGAA